MTQTSTASLAATDRSAGSAPSDAGHGHGHGHGHDHAHDPAHGPHHDHAHDHPHDHDHPTGGHAPTTVRPTPSLVRASLATRLALALAISGVIWAGVMWARLPIAG